MQHKLKKTILEASVLFVNKSGFTQTSLSRGVSILNLSPASHRIVEKGPIELVNFVLDDIHTKMYNDLNGLENRDEEHFE